MTEGIEKTDQKSAGSTPDDLGIDIMTFDLSNKFWIIIYEKQQIQKS